MDVPGDIKGKRPACLVLGKSQVLVNRLDLRGRYLCLYRSHLLAKLRVFQASKHSRGSAFASIQETFASSRSNCDASVAN
jgi:hypothetical protein